MFKKIRTLYLTSKLKIKLDTKNYNYILNYIKNFTSSRFDAISALIDIKIETNVHAITNTIISILYFISLQLLQLYVPVFE